MVPGDLGPGARVAPGRRVRRSRAAGRGAARAHAGRRPAVVDRRGAPGGDRLVLAADEPGPGAARGAGRGRDHLDRASGGQPARVRPDRAPVPARPARAAPARARAAPPQAAVALSRQWAARRDRGVHAVRRHRRDEGPRGAAQRAGRDGGDHAGRRGGTPGSAVHRRRRGPDAGRGGARGRGRGHRRGAAAAGGLRAGCGVRGAARPAGVGPRPARAAVRVRVPLGGLRAGGQAPLRLLRAAAALRRPVRGPHRAPRSTGRRARCGCSACGGRTASIHCDPAHPGFVEAFAAAVRAHATFADLTKVVLPRTARDRTFLRAVRERL